MKRTILTLILIFVLSLTHGQVETKFYPDKNALEQVKPIQNHPQANKVKAFPSFDVQKLINEDKLKEGLDIPFRFGKGFDANITLNDGEWTNVEGGRLWSMEFQSKGAYSINFVFNHFYLPDSAELYISNVSGTMLYGPVTSRENTKNGFFLTDLVQGDDVTIYLFEPTEKIGKSQLTIQRVVHAYKNLIPSSYGNLGGSLSCNNDIACFPAWDEESDAVALVLLSSGTELCSGSLLMTADQSFQSYFLSAFHCIDISSPYGSLSSTEISDAENWMFKFQYKMTSCGGSTGTTGITYNGAQYRAAWNSSDFALMEMDNSPLGDTRFSWLGWDRSGNTPTSGTGIHHPSGDVMKISFDYTNLTENTSQISWSNGTVSPVNTHWVVGFDSGTTEGGSSGSPLFDQNMRVVGQLHGGSSGCPPVTKYYGQIDRSWTGGGTNTTRLSNWLDPCGSGALTTNTARTPYVSGPYNVCMNGTSFTIGNLPPVDSIVWEHGPYLTISSGQNTANCTFSAVGNGNSWVRARLFTGCGEGITLPDKDVATVWPSGTWVQNGQSHPLNTVNFITYGSWIQATVSCPGLTGSNWVLTHSSGISWNQGFYNGMSYVNLYPSTPQSYADFRLDLNTADCGTISPTYHFVPGYGYAFTMSPNPAEDEVVVKRLDKNQVDERNTLKPKLEKYKQKEFKTWDTPQEKFTVKLYSERLGLLKTVHTEDESCRIDLRSLPAGTYFLHIENDYVLYQEQLIIRK